MNNINNSVFVLMGLLLVMIVVMAASGIYSSVYGYKLLHYLKRHNYSRWEEITSIGRFGPGLNSPLRVSKYLRSNLDNDDTRICAYKRFIKKGGYCFLTSFVSTIVVLLLTMYLLT